VPPGPPDEHEDEREDEPDEVEDAPVHGGGGGEVVDHGRNDADEHEISFVLI